MNPSYGDLLSATQGIIVHGCNAQGVMGSGVALAVRERYPEAFAAYRQAYEANGLRPGEVVWHRVSKTPPLAIANAITQDRYGRDPSVRYVDYDAVRKSFTEIAAIARRHNLDVHYPKIGAGLGNGDWGIIEAILNETLEGVRHTLWVPDPPASRAKP